MMNVIYISPYDDDFTKEEQKVFWDSGISLDDWNCILLFPVEILQEKNYEDGDNDSKYYVDDYDINRMIESCDGEYCWYKVMFRGKEYAAGIKYH